MKGYIYLILHFYLVISCNYIPKNSHETSDQVKNNQHLAKIEIIYVDMFMTAFFSVDCDNFDDPFFAKISKKQILTETEEMQKLSDFVETTLARMQLEKIIDVRGKMRFHYTDNSTEEICFGLHRIEIKKQRYAISDEFREYLLKITETKR